MTVKKRKAKKGHCCRKCNKRIEKGKEYYDSNYMGVIWMQYAARYCRDCVEENKNDFEIFGVYVNES